MTNYDVFNGDTDGIFAWHQLRLAHPRDATLVTGVKRDVGLVGRVEAGEGDLVTVLDVSHAKHRKDVDRGRVRHHILVKRGSGDITHEIKFSTKF